MKVSRELKTGIIALLTIALTIWGYNFLKNRSIYDKTRVLFVEYENIQGLNTASPVTISGLNVGKVSKITFHPAKKETLVVHVQLTNAVEFSKNSIAKIYSPSFIAGKSLKIEFANDGAEIAKSGDTLRGEIDHGLLGALSEQFGPLETKMESFVVSTDSVMQNLNKVLDGQNQKNIKSSLYHLSLTLEKLSSLTNNADEILENNNAKIDSVLSNADLAMKNLAQLTSDFQKADIATTMLNLKQSLESFSNILETIENGDGTIGKLMNDDELYNHLEGASKELEALLKDFKLHPKRYVNVSVFGKKEKPYQEETKETEEK